MIFGEGPIIKNIAGDLNKLFLQGSRAGQPITNVEGDAAADQGTADLLAAMDPVIREVSVGMTGVEAASYTVSGTPPLSLPNSLGKPLKAWAFEVSPYQEGSGDPSPSNVRPIHGTDKLNMFAEESYDQSATPKAVITLPKTVYTGTIGSEEGESRWGEVDLGTLKWLYFNIEGHRRFGAVIDAKPNTANLLCSCYKAVAYSDVFDNTAVGIAIHTDGTQVVIYDPDYTDAASFKAAMTGMQLVYELATPTTFPLTSSTIPTPSGTATTWATAEDGTVDSMEVTYVGKA